MANADLVHADLVHVDLVHADLVHADLVHADLVHADLVHAINDTHRLILAIEATHEDRLIDIIYDVCDKPYAFECACALANSTTSATWFVGACARNIWPLIHWLIFMYGDANARYKHTAFCAACTHGHGSVARWLSKLSWYGVKDAEDMIHATSNNGMFRLTKHMLILYEWYFHEQGDSVYLKRYTLVQACKHRRIWFIRWLDEVYGLTHDDICADDMDAFATACEKGHWRMARWMTIRFDLTKVDMREAIYMPLIAACARGQLHIARWLVECFRLGARDVRHGNNAVFVRACANGHLEVAQWLADQFRLVTRDARSRHNGAVIGASQGGHTSVAQWLVTRFGLGREGSRVSGYYTISTYTTLAPVDALKWYAMTFEPRRRHADSLYHTLINAAGSKSHAEFAWWAAKRFGVMPTDVETMLDWYKQQPDVPEWLVAEAQRWSAAYAAEW